MRERESERKKKKERQREISKLENHVEFKGFFMKTEEKKLLVLLLLLLFCGATGTKGKLKNLLVSLPDFVSPRVLKIMLCNPRIYSFCIFQLKAALW